MKTFILMWNPAISNFKEKDFNALIENAEWATMSWSVWDHDLVEDGDRVFLARVGEGNTGIVMSGTVFDGPEEGEDWSGKGRKTFYLGFGVDAMVNSDEAPVLTTEELMKAMPDFDWTGGHSGRLLPEEYQVKLELMWLAYINANQEVFNGEKGGFIDFANSIEVNDILQAYLNKEKGNACYACGYDYQKTWGADCEEQNDYYLFWDEESTKRPYYDMLKRIRSVCDNCLNIDDEILKARLFKK